MHYGTPYGRRTKGQPASRDSGHTPGGTRGRATPEGEMLTATSSKEPIEKPREVVLSLWGKTLMGLAYQIFILQFTTLQL